MGTGSGWTESLFGDEPLGEGAAILRGFTADAAGELLRDLDGILANADGNGVLTEEAREQVKTMVEARRKELRKK